MAPPADSGPTAPAAAAESPAAEPAADSVPALESPAPAAADAPATAKEEVASSVETAAPAAAAAAAATGGEVAAAEESGSSAGALESMSGLKDALPATAAEETGAEEAAAAVAAAAEGAESAEEEVRARPRPTDRERLRASFKSRVLRSFTSASLRRATPHEKRKLQTCGLMGGCGCLLPEPASQALTPRCLLHKARLSLFLFVGFLPAFLPDEKRGNQTLFRVCTLREEISRVARVLCLSSSTPFVGFFCRQRTVFCQ